MATRSRRSAATEVVEEEEEQDSGANLAFNQSLISRPGKTISISDLLARLKALNDELRGLEQEEVQRESVEPVAKELAHHGLLSHKDAGVRAWTACNIVDMFRLCAPDAPYTAAQLKDIFILIVTKIIPLIADPSHPYNAQHLYVLRSLAEIKSIVLLVDIPNSETLTSNLFTTCFDVLSGGPKATSGELLSKNVEHHMTQILSILVDESQHVSADVTDVILAQFLRADVATLNSGTTKGKKSAPVDANQSTLLMKEAPPPYNMAKNICNSCPDKMARAIGSYFSTVIVDVTSGGSALKQRGRKGNNTDDSDDEGHKGPSEDDLNEASKAHRLLRELWRCCPGVLQEIIPHLQEELGAENTHLRQMATETFGDMIAGIGAAGPPPLPLLNPLAYPSQSIAPSSELARAYNFLTTPTSLHSFPVQHAAAYSAFLQRKQDKSPNIRAAWSTAIGRILMTSAGGVGLEPEEEKKLLRYFAETLIDSDDRVRLAALKAIEHFEFNDIVQKLGSIGGMSEPGSLLSNLADRVKDKKNIIHTESMKLLGKIWGVASGAIAEGNDRITNLLGSIPSRILEACYVNDLEINVQVDLTMYESLLPLGYPPMKVKSAVNGGSHAVKDSQPNGESVGYTEVELDKIRTERQLVLVRGLEEKAKKVFFARQANQAAGTTYMETFLKRCEDYNGGVMEKGEKEEKQIKSNLTALIQFYAKTLPDSQRVIDDLWKFAKAHDRRNYQLIRFCMAPDREYKMVVRSIKELKKRVEDSSTSSTLWDTLLPLVYRVSLLCYNKSHVPAIIEFSRTDEKGLGATAHEILKEISTKHPKVFSAHVQELCKALEGEAPTATKPNGPGAVDDLKACAGFARKFPKDLPTERKFVQSMINFALYGTPPKAAKHAVTIIMSSATKKEMHAKDILSKSTKGFRNGSDHYLTKLAAISQLVLLAPHECEDDTDPILNIAINQVLLRPHVTSPESETEWMDPLDDDMVARTWALKILVNRLRALPSEVNISEAAKPVYKLLNKMVKHNGEAYKTKDTPLAHRNMQRLLAGNLLLKLSCIRRFDGAFSPANFNHLAVVAQDACFQVRKGFVTKLMKYLGQNRLPPRYYTILFLLAFEPDNRLREGVITWIRSRRAALATRKDITLENIFARLLSLLAHHPDFETETETLKLMTQYILFYLKSVATPDNLSLIFHVAQRVKGVADGITPSMTADENLYVLSDLSQAVIRIWEEQNGWSMQSWPGKLKLPAGIFKALESHERAQEIADKVWVSDEILEELEPTVRASLRSKKRKAADGDDKNRKKAKADKTENKKQKLKSERKLKTPKKWRRSGDDDDDDDEEMGTRQHKAPTSEVRRKSGRGAAQKSYVELSDEDEEEDVAAEGEDEKENSEGDQEENSTEEGDGNASKAHEDVEMEDAPEAVPEEETELSGPEFEAAPEPEPPKKAAKGKASRKTNAELFVPQSEPELPKQVVKAKLGKKANGTATSPAQKKTLAERSKKASPVKSNGTKGKGEATEPISESETTTTSSPAAAASTKKGANRKDRRKAKEMVSPSPAAAAAPTRRSARTRG
ncbi:hypothetical protein GQ43DRAFT_480972 [Delitschia confertaspora ATCC 74209]|uniref:Uncharacterized protein n=1 Tax=Delitschia confertaspora ATCC 74209 TaxID=1513339 RepID=A0A9P4JMU0_9PLEO|nr:hypothetical protein GQ43DRAFT_480972 [Delitschia confertaspora ATCC 74209]